MRPDWIECAPPTPTSKERKMLTIRRQLVQWHSWQQPDRLFGCETFSHSQHMDRTRMEIVAQHCNYIHGLGGM
jgi:hypothetical protein